MKTKKHLVSIILALSLLFLLLSQQQNAIAQPVNTGFSDEGSTSFDGGAPILTPSGPGKDESKAIINSNVQVVAIAGWYFVPARVECPMYNWFYGAIGPSDDPPLSSGCYLTFPVLLPSGTKITRIDLNYYDISLSLDIQLSLRRSPYNASGEENIVTITSGTSSGAGYSYADIDHVILPHYSYHLMVYFPLGSDADITRLNSVEVYYQSPSIFGQALPLIQRP